MAGEYGIIGINGDGGAGKDYVAAKIAEHGFVPVSASTILREIIAARGIQTSRAIQTRVANEIRAERGGEYFAAEALRRAQERWNPDATGIVITGIYCVAEGLFLKRQGGRLAHVTISTEDSLEARFARLQQRADGSRDSLDQNAFRAAHQRENSGLTDAEANVAALARLADAIIINNGNDAFLDTQIKEFLGR